MVAQPMVAQPMVAQPMVAQPMVAQPMVAQPMVGQPMPMASPAPMAAPSPMGAAPMARPAAVWMPPPGAIPGCPPGLEFLAMLDMIIVEQLVELLEVFTGIDTANRYVIRNPLGQQVYYAMELATGYTSSFRAFTIRITDNRMMDVCRVSRPGK